MTDSSATHGDDTELLLGRLVEEFTVRRRAGERPEVDEYVARHPEHAATIREMLDTVAALEQAEPHSGEEQPAGLAITRIGDYRIEREIGRGGMGVVFLATDERLDREVALKLLPVQATLDVRFLERFRREARAAAGLQHPHIVPVFGVGEHEGLHYYAMRYVEGSALDELAAALRERDPEQETSDGDASSVESLARRLLAHELSDDSGIGSGGTVESGAEKPLPSPLPTRAGRTTYHRNVARLGLQVAGALTYAHARGILHRDVKPANLLLDERGHVWIADFGLCTTGEDSQLTMSTDMIGTLRYMAPEQVEGRADVRSDVYGLGITLYELLTLRPAFAGRDRAALMKHVVEREPARPRRIDPEIPPDLEAIVLKATAKLPEERYGTTEGLADDLRAFLAGRPIAARPPGALHLLRLAIRRNRVLASTIVAAALLLLVASVLYVLGVQKARAEEVRQLYLANVAAATASIDVDPRGALRSLERAPVKHRNWEWEHLSARANQSIARIAELGSRGRDLAITPDGSHLVAASGNRVAVIELDFTEPPRLSDPLTSEAMQVDVHPDGGRAAVRSGFDALVMNLEGRPRIIARRRMESAAMALTYDSSGERIYIATHDGLIRCFDDALERELFLLRGHPGQISDLVPTPDGRLVSAGLDRTVRLWDPALGRARVLSGHESEVHKLDVSSDGRLLASLGANGVLRLWDLSSGAPLGLWRGPLHGHELRFSPDNRFVVSGHLDRTLRVWDVLALTEGSASAGEALAPAPIRIWNPLTDRALQRLAGHGAFVQGIVFGPDGRLFSASYDGIVLEWDVEAAGGLLVLVGHLSDSWGLAFDATGTRLASTSRDTTVRLWNAETGSLQRVLFSGSVPYGVSFSPDGSEVAALCRDGALRIWDAASGEELAQLSCPEEGVSEQIAGTLRYDPDGKLLYITEYRRGLDAWERTPDGWRFARHLSVPGAFKLDLSPDGSHVAVTTVDGRLWLVDVRTWATRFEVPAHTDQIRSVTFRPDGDALATGGPDGFVRIWAVPGGELLDAFPVRTASAFEGDIEGLAYSPDGSRLACVLPGAGVELWDPERGEHVSTLQGPGTGYNQVVFDVTGRRIASGSWGGDVRVWDTVSALERRGRIRAGAGTGGGTPGHARAGRKSFAALLERARSRLRAAERDPAGIHEARWIGRGLHKEHPTDPRVLLVFGEALYRAGLFEEGVAFLVPAVEAADQEGHGSFDALVFLSMTLSELGRLDEAEVALERARSAIAGAASHGVIGPEDLLREAEESLREARRETDG